MSATFVPTLSVDGTATAYRLYDVGYGIGLDHAAELAGADTRGRSLPGRAEAQAFLIRNPPLNVMLGEREVRVDGHLCRAMLAAHLFDFGVCSMRLTVDAPRGATWQEFTAFGNAFDALPDMARSFDAELTTLLARIGLAIERQRVAQVAEEYVVFRIGRVSAAGDERRAAELLTDDHLVPLLLSERRALSASARREILAHRFSYYSDDLAVITWDNALVVEPRANDFDIEFVVEFANAQLLELRVYDAELDAELPTLYDRIAAARRRLLPVRRFSSVISTLQLTIADITEIVERADNAFKVTDDVYLARIYAGALEVFRERAWRSGIDRKLGILRDTYTMLNGEAQATRAELLEIAIVILIVAELLFALTRR
ncbi:MAG TPA: hypothetical protein VJ867_07280 [Gemmatimonadaceae bacterium]|nr:hypothetical protein [Gemmatimonadaceae bacterium]